LNGGVSKIKIHGKVCAWLNAVPLSPRGKPLSIIHSNTQQQPMAEQPKIVSGVGRTLCNECRTRVSFANTHDNNSFCLICAEYVIIVLFFLLCN
jgi:hypothetical protein